MFRDLRAETKLIIILCIVTFAVYANTLKNGFAYDDISVITKNSIVTKGISAIPEIFTTPYRWGFFINSNEMYRPLSQVMFAVEYQLFSGDPGPMHLVNVIFIIGCVVLLFRFVLSLFDEEAMTIAFVTALLFALHPVHTEVVANIKSRDELMCFFFSFLSLLVFIRYIRSGKLILLAAGGFCFLVALFSKETAVFFLPVILLVFFFYRNSNKTRSVYITAVSVAAAAFFLFVRFKVLGAYNAGHIYDVPFIDNQLTGAPSLSSRLATAVLVVGKYLQLLMFPYPLICDYSYSTIPFVNFSDIRVLFTLALCAGLVLWSIYRFVKYRRDPLAFAVFLMIGFILAFSNAFFLIGATMGERFLFFASAGFCLFVALLFQKWSRVGSWSGLIQRKMLLAAILLLLGLDGWLIMVRNSEWKDSITLYESDVRKAPSNARLYFFLGNELLINGMTNTADGVFMVNRSLENFRKAVEIYPGYLDANKMMAKGFFSLSKLDSAEIYLNKVITLRHSDTEALNNLNVIYFTAQKYTQAIKMCKKILATDSFFVEKYNDIAICYLHMGKHDSAIASLNTAIGKNPGYGSSYANLALAYKMKGIMDSARKYEVAARTYFPGFSVY